MCPSPALTGDTGVGQITRHSLWAGRNTMFSTYDVLSTYSGSWLLLLSKVTHQPTPFHHIPYNTDKTDTISVHLHYNTVSYDILVYSEVSD